MEDINPLKDKKFVKEDEKPVFIPKDVASILGMDSRCLFVINKLYDPTEKRTVDQWRDQWVEDRIIDK